ncbi:MAG: zinc-ribbon domain-containing protein [Promethearchaeota archaeon]
MVQSNNDLEEFPKWIMIVILLFFGAFILVPVGIAAPPDAFAIVAAVFIPLIGIAMIFVIFMGKNKTVQKMVNMKLSYQNNKKASKQELKAISTNINKSSNIRENLLGQDSEDMENFAEKPIICPYCGVEVKQGTKYCPSCGSQLY